MIDTPGWLQRASVLTDTIDARRLRIALDLLRRAGPRVLMRQVMVHTAFRWRLRELGVGVAESGLVPVVEESNGPIEAYREPSWPDGEPLISVIIPCFNYGAFVAEAVDSVLAQTFRDLEIIVVEGGSTDADTRRTVAELKRPKTRKLFRDKPCPVGDNRNFGIREARGKYICCLDADDVLLPTYLEKAAFLLETTGADVVSTSVKQFGAADGGYAVKYDPDLRDMLEANQIATCAVFRRSLWERSGGFQDMPPGQSGYIHEDWRLWMRFAALGARIRNIAGEQLLRYRAHNLGSLSKRPDILPMAEQAEAIRELNRDVITPDALKESRSRAALRLRSDNGLRNLIRRADGGSATPTILVAMPHLILGGAERLLSEVVRGLGQSGYRVIIVTTVPTTPELSDTTGWFERTTSEIYHLPRFLPESQWLDFLEYVVSAKRVQAMLLAGSPFFYRAIPELKQRHPHLRIVDLLFNTVAHAQSNRGIARLLDSTIAEGDDVRSWLLESGERPERVCLIPSGIDLDSFRPTERPSRLGTSLGFPPDTFIVGFSGRLAEEKAPLSFVRIAGLVDEQGINFVMTGAGALEGEVRSALRRGKLEDRLHFAGMVDDVTSYLGGYDVLVVPSLFDGRPTVVMEALAMGIPVIASKVGSLPDMIIDGKTGFLCESSDLSAFAERIIWLRRHPAEHSRMRLAARAFAEQHFRLDQMVSSYVGLFDRLTERRSPPAGRRDDLSQHQERAAALLQ